MFLVGALLTIAAISGVAPLILRQWALRRAEQDPVAAWFGFAIRLNWVGMATMLVIPGAIVFRAQFWSLFHGHMPEPVAGMLRFMICMLPAAAMRVTATLVANDLSRRLRGVETPSRMTAELALLQAASLLLTFPLIGAGIAAFDTWGLEAAILMVLSAITIAVAAAVRGQRLQGFRLHAVTSGELRDRVFALAAKGGVRLEQVFALPLAKWKHANAFAMQGRRLLVTDYLLEHLDRDEVDAVMAHEVAHLAGKDPERQAMLMSVIVATGTVIAMFGVPPLAVFAVVLFGTFVWLGYSRRCEYGADARALTLGVSPRAAISGLAKLNRLGYVPMDYPMFVEWWLTHPSTTRRARAVGRRAELAADEVERLLAPGSTATMAPSASVAATPTLVALPSHERYVAPALEPDAKRFSTSFKQMTTTRISLLAMLVGIASSLAVVNAARFLGLLGFWRFALWPVGTVLVAGALLGLIDWLACAGYRVVAKAVADRMAAALPDGLRDGICVGLAPHAVPRVYEGFSVWDVGLVTLHGRLDYRGEETRFSLSRDEVTEVSLGPGPPGWISSKRVLVAWRRADGSSGVFAFAPSGMSRLSAIRGEAWKLYMRIRQWRSPNPGSVIEAPVGPPLGPPPTGEVTAQIPGADITARMFLSLSMIYLFLTSLFGALVRMPAGFSPIPGILDAVLVVVLGHVLLLAPIMRANARVKTGTPADPRERQAA